MCLRVDASSWSWLVVCLPDDHANTLLKTLPKDRSEGKVSGPYKSSVALEGAIGRFVPLHNYPFNEAAASVAFSIVNTAADGSVEVRRGEDWRRSFHNATFQTRDAPHHHRRRRQCCSVASRPETT